MTKKELKNYYQVSYTTLQKWLAPFENEIGKMIGGKYTPRQVEIIKSKLG